MPPPATQLFSRESSPSTSPPAGHPLAFENLRSIRWRINLGILPSSPRSSFHVLRRVAAESRRRYTGLRRRLLIDPHFSDGYRTPDLAMDNPLSQNPESTWGRFFRNAELEKMVDQDLSRLYPEHDSYFQKPACQATLRRILLLWSLRHPEYGYRQGMHELLAPLLYVLHVDVQHLAQVRELYEDHFNDKFDSVALHESSTSCNLKFKIVESPISTKWAVENNIGTDFEGSMKKICKLDELDPDIQTIILLNDSYGAEGELGILLSDRFMEHDAYCMFDALMSGASGVVAMADFFSPSPAIGSLTGLPPVIEASSALYHLLSEVDSSLYSHLVELGVEPQYFALRWLRVLFGREFSLADLLVIWDKIFASPNDQSDLVLEDDMKSSFKVLSSPRGAFIAAVAVAMLLHLRSSLLATENATICLQRLLNFLGCVEVDKLVEKASSFQDLALATVVSAAPSLSVFGRSNLAISSGHSSTSLGPVSTRTPLNLYRDSYWEEKWRVLHNAEEVEQGSSSDQKPSGVKMFEKRRLIMGRSVSLPRSAEWAQISARRKLLGVDKLRVNEVPSLKDPFAEAEAPLTKRMSMRRPVAVGENSFLKSSSSQSRANDNDSEKSSAASCISTEDNDDESGNMEEPCSNMSSAHPLPVSKTTDDSVNLGKKETTVPKEHKSLSGKFHWFWKFSRSGEGGSSNEAGDIGSDCKSLPDLSTNDECRSSYGIDNQVDIADKKLSGTLRNLAQSMLENIQVIESVFKQNLGCLDSSGNLAKNSLDVQGQNSVMAALKELQKISNLLSDM